jgi:putative DNA-invertase from lambdoid prophage Rac
MANKVYGYLRVSTDKQNIDNYRNWILRKANDLKIGPVVWTEETVSGGQDWQKREIGKLYDRCIKGDTIITFESSRIGRNIKQTMEFLSCCDRKGIKVYSNDLGEDDSVESSLQTFVAQISSQRERENTKKRTKEALATRKLDGMKLGQNYQNIMNLDKDGKGIFRNETNEENIHNLLVQGVKIKNIASRYNLHPIVLGKYIKKWDLKKPKDERDPEKLRLAIEASDIASKQYLLNQSLKSKYKKARGFIKDN